MNVKRFIGFACYVVAVLITIGAGIKIFDGEAGWPIPTFLILCFIVIALGILGGFLVMWKKSRSS